MKSKEATGPDEISLKLLKSLGTHMLNEHLDVYNLSFLHIDWLKIWTIATIILLYKSGKHASEVAFFCPVS